MLIEKILDTNITSVLKFIGSIIVIWVVVCITATAQTNRPNILLIQVDDMGYDDLSCNGNTVSRTPHIDAFARSAVRFKNFMLCNVCSPTRASLLTGRDFWRTGVSGMHGGNDFMHLDETTFAEIFQKNGYVTGMWGKWHAGKNDGYWPWDRGFDEGFYANLYHYYPSNGYHNGTYVSHGGKWSDEQIVDYAIDFISRNKDKPFLAYVSSLTCHGIWNTPGKYKNKYMTEGRTENFAILLGMLEFMDDQVGRLLQYLKDNGLYEQTLIIFMSDNGPTTPRGQDLPDDEWDLRNNHVFLGSKANNWQNGLKSPLFIKWGDHYTAGPINRWVSITDIFPTLLDIADIPVPSADLSLDGRSFKPYLEGDTISLPEKKAIFAHWSPIRDEQQFAPIVPEQKESLDFSKQRLTLITEHNKLLLNPRNKEGTPEQYNQAVLIDLIDHPMETVNSAAGHPEILIDMKQELQDWFDEIINEPHSFAPPVFQIGWEGKTSSMIQAYGPSNTVGVENGSHELGGWDETGDYAEYRINVHYPGLYNIAITTGNSFMQGMSLKISCKNSETGAELSNATSHELGQLYLEAGENTLTLEVSSIAAGTSPEIRELKSLRFSLDDDFKGLSDPDATKETVMLFGNLKKTGRRGIIFGQQHACYEAQNWKDINISTDLKSDCHTSTGDHPGVFGFDFNKGFNLFKDYVEEIYRRGGISTFSWHAQNPVTGGLTWDAGGNPVSSILAGGKYWEIWKDELDQVADFFNNLMVDGVNIPVIFRPFHENTGSWFWWGSGNCTDQEFIDLWRLTVDYLREDRGVNNILMAYSPSIPSMNEALAKSMYPGDDYVDIIGFDSYGQYEDLKTVIVDCSRIICNWAAEADKVPAITEAGIKKGLQNSTNNDWFMSGFLDPLKNDEAGQEVAYVLTWRNSSHDKYWVPLPGQSHYRSFINFYNDTTTYFLKDLVNIYGNSNDERVVLLRCQRIF